MSFTHKFCNSLKEALSHKLLIYFYFFPIFIATLRTRKRTHSQNPVDMFLQCNCMYDVFQADTRALKLNAWKQLAYEEGM